MNSSAIPNLSKPDSFWEALFYADSIAVIGATDRAGSWGLDAMQAALAASRMDTSRHAYAVNPNTRKVLGETSYRSILDIPGPVDLAIIVVPATAATGVLRECVRKHVRAAVIITAGFAEIGSEGAGIEAELVAIARKGGLRFVGPNCMGHANAHSGISSADFASKIAPGSMALLSQSGMLSASIIQLAASMGVGLSKFVGTGNEADLHFEDYLEYLGRDEDTRVIAAYIEGLREGRRFFSLAREITARKPIVVIKAGTTAGSSRAARSHTGALTGSDVVYDAVFKQTGVLRTDDEEELCDMVMALLTQPLPRGPRVGIITVGGGMGVMTAEACEKEGLQVASFEAQTLQKLNALLSPLWSHGNPVDIVNIRSLPRQQVFSTCLGILMEDRNVDCVVAIMPPQATFMNLMESLSPELIQEIRTERQKMESLMNEQVRIHDKPIFLIRKFMPPINRYLSKSGPAPEDGIPEFSHPRRAARAMNHLAWYRRYLEEA